MNIYTYTKIQTMKSKFNLILIYFIFTLCISINPEKVSAQEGSITFQVFYDELSPYGTWVDNYEYGYVWIPNVNFGFTPYSTNGYWLYTDEGWAWVSYYSWGWAPFHYGRWFNDNHYGYMWIPDNEWGPGWVTWRQADGYYGWAPIGPNVQVSVAYSVDYEVANNQWTFVKEKDFGKTNIDNYYIKNKKNGALISKSKAIKNIRKDDSRNVIYNAGPDKIEVEKSTGKSISQISIKAIDKPGQHLNNDQLQMYRPKMEKNIPDQQKPVPLKVEKSNTDNRKSKGDRNKQPIYNPKNNSNDQNNQKRNPSNKQNEGRQKQESKPLK